MCVTTFFLSHQTAIPTQTCLPNIAILRMLSITPNTPHFVLVLPSFFTIPNQSRPLNNLTASNTPHIHLFLFQVPRWRLRKYLGNIRHHVNWFSLMCENLVKFSDLDISDTVFVEGNCNICKKDPFSTLCEKSCLLLNLVLPIRS